MSFRTRGVTLAFAAMTDASKRVVVGMSGGVDSTVAVSRLLREGYEVIGVTLRMWTDACQGDDEQARESVMMARHDEERDAQAMAKVFGIQHLVVDKSEAFRTGVVEPFLQAYQVGHTPCPCAVCNPLVKIPSLIEVARKLDAAWVATGHYARVVKHANGFRVARGVDRTKDQSYFLVGLTNDMLGRLLLPLGNDTKQQVREEAISHGWVSRSKSESQDLCFVGDRKYAQFVEQHVGEKLCGGWIVDAQGRQLARHRGVHNFTLGQRKGLGIAVGRPVFVCHIDPRSAQVVVGDESASMVSSVEVARPNVAPGVSFPLRARVQVRYRDKGTPATVIVGDDGAAQFVFDTPVRAATPGQFAVAYVDDEVQMGGMITRVVMETASSTAI